jgi:hypothetical protein
MGVMSEEERAEVRAAIARAQARAAAAASKEPEQPVETPQDVMRRRLERQWQDVVGPVLHGLKEELVSAGHEVVLYAPGEANDGSFSIEADTPSTHWKPGVTFSVAEDGSGIRVVATFGEVRTNQPVVAELQPDELTAKMVASLVVRLVDEGL